MKFALRSVLLSLGVLALFTLQVETSSAASTVTIGQMSRYDVVGTWVLKMPNNQTVESTDPYVDASLYTIKNALNGTYTITFEPPRGSDMTVTVRNGTTKISESAQKTATFTVTDGDDFRVMADYTFHGTISVGSEPQGANFRLTGTSGVDLTGTTPAQFSGLPPVQYSVYYSQREGCTIPKPQHRELSEDRPLAFFATYVCGDTTAEPEPELPPEREEPGAEARRQNIARVEVDTIITQTEVLPGGTMFLVLRIHNPSSKLIRNLEVREAFDAANLSVIGALPKDGSQSEGMLLWTINDLKPREYWNVTVEMEVDDAAPAGTQLDFTTSVTSDDLVRPAGDIASVRVVGSLPQTGNAVDALFVLLTAGLTVGMLRIQKKNIL